MLAHALHAVNDVDAGGQVVPLLGQLYAVKVVDALLAGGHVCCHGADAVGDRLDHNLQLKQLAIQDYRLLIGVELRADGLCDGAVVEDEVADVSFDGGVVESEGFCIGSKYTLPLTPLISVRSR